MNPSGIYKKTDKGIEEIKSRSHGLPARYRPLLIMVDGKTTLKELLEKVSVITDAQQQLQMMLEQGFIEEVQQTAPAAPAVPPPSAASVPAAAAPSQDLADAKRLLIRMLYDALGPAADALAVKIEAVLTQEELKALALKSRDVVQAARGNRFAETFWSGIAAHLPPD